MKSKRIILVCEECLDRNYHSYKSDPTQRLIIKKHCSRCNKHTLHKETR